MALFIFGIITGLILGIFFTVKAMKWLGKEIEQLPEDSF